jgi:HD-GYP domain-containing protein (c-di-GMP phosphodiesterase class II)
MSELRKRVAVKDLQFGMYVFELDRPWTETPFVFQGFTLRNEQQLEILRKHCQYVLVDQERSDAVLQPQLGPAAAAGHSSGGPLPGTRRVAHAERVTVSEELPPAREARTHAETRIAAVFQTLKAGGALDADSVKSAVQRMSESILRNPDALMLFSALKARGGYFLDRAMNCSIYLITFTRFLGMEQPDIERAGMVGMSLDVGMLQIPEAILHKPGPLTPEEIKIVRTHVDLGAKKMEESGMSPEIVALASQHHERADGSGYPSGLRAAEMSVIGACAGIIDTFGAMTTKRPYADAISPSNVLGIMHKWKDRVFNGWLIEEFIRCIGVFPVGSVVELNSGEVGVVISQNTIRRLQPRVLVVRDSNGNPVHPHKLLDLSRSPKATAEEPYRIRRTLEYGRSGVSAQDLFL